MIQRGDPPESLLWHRNGPLPWLLKGLKPFPQVQLMSQISSQKKKHILQYVLWLVPAVPLGFDVFFLGEISWDNGHLTHKCAMINRLSFSPISLEVTSDQHEWWWFTHCLLIYLGSLVIWQSPNHCFMPDKNHVKQDMPNYTHVNHN